MASLKINGAAYQGVFVERKTAFVKITFSSDISAIVAANLTVLGTATAAGTGTIADSTFGIVESAIVQALKTLETKATVLAISKYNTTSYSVDVMLGNGEGWFSDTNGLIATGLPVSNAQAVVTTAGAAPTNVVGALVSVLGSAVTFQLQFTYLDGSMPVGTTANGALVLGPGSTPGNIPAPGNNPVGTYGYGPVSV